MTGPRVRVSARGRRARGLTGLINGVGALVLAIVRSRLEQQAASGGGGWLLDRNYGILPHGVPSSLCG